MKIRYSWAGALALAITLIPILETQGSYTNSDGIIITNGVVLIATRSATDAFWRQQSSSTLWDGDDAKGPGILTPGDAGMAILLQDYGYTVRLVPEKVLSYTANDGSSTMDWLTANNDPVNYYNGGGGPSSTTSNVLWSAMLVIVSGGGGSADMPPPNTNGVPIIMGEHSCLGNNTVKDHSQLFLYSSKSSGNLTSGGLYMKVVAPDHPIMQGIPLDSQGRVKIFRDPYPEETLHNAPGGKSNYEISWTAVDCSEGKSVPAPGLTQIGVLDSSPNQVVFAVFDAGGTLADTTEFGDTASPWYGYTKAPSRIVHFFVNEGGSGNSRRAFNALTVWGRIIFVRMCKWAMGETLEPYKSFNVIDVGQVSAGRIKLTWQGAADKSYRIDGSTDFVSWQPVIDSIPGGVNGPVSRTLDISAGPEALFMRLAALP